MKREQSAPHGKDVVFFLPGNHLFPLDHMPDCEGVTVVMVEDATVCSRRPYHQQKLALMIAAMREHAAALREAGFSLDYSALSADQSINSAIERAVRRQRASTLVTFPVSDVALRARLNGLCHRLGIEWHELDSDPAFLTSADAFVSFAGSKKRVRMADFYIRQRKQHDVLLNSDGHPRGGKWSFDAENRKKLPQSQSIPVVAKPLTSDITAEAIAEVARRFSSHPGRADQLWLPTDRRGALDWLRAFVEQRLVGFGTYEDAITQRSATVFHSTLSPLLNLGLLTPDEVLEEVMTHTQAMDVPLNDIEGFVRQLLGWREFVRGVYHQYGPSMRGSNSRGHHRRLTAHWHEARTGIPPLDDAIRHQLDYGWTHHINRLMVLANLMNLCEIEPHEVYEYFMTYYIDAYDWVMVPNVYGMGLACDDGTFATKPYVCGSNYLLKMSDFPRGDWCDVVDGLYWRFVRNNRAEYQGNHRLRLALANLDKMDQKRAEKIFAAADNFLARVTHLPSAA
ncbi:MAG: cryptochrome/photolyase family protein [Pseudomonadales bacterium]